MEKKVWEYITCYGMIQENDKIIIGLSGGADSVALLVLLAHFRAKKKYNICAVHINHNLRGKEAFRDENFAREIAGKYDVAFYCESVDVEGLATQWGMGLEEAGRQVRKDIFRKYGRELDCNKIAIAHNKNDLAETVVHNLCRGSSLKGLCGILPVHEETIRPILCLERWEIEQYLKENGVLYMEDHTNYSMDYTRNRIRHGILEDMCHRINPQTVEHISQTAQDIQKLETFLGGIALEELERWGKAGNNGIWLSQEIFRQDSVISTEVILQAIDKVCYTRKDISRYHITEILALGEKEVGKSVSLPKGWEALRDYKGILIHKRSNDRSDKFCMNLSENGVTVLPSGVIRARVFPYDGGEIFQKRYTKWLNYDKIKEIVQIRNRRQGDYLIINGAGQHKKLKDYFIDCKIPAKEREEIPLLAIKDEILWVVGYRINEAYRIVEDTREILEVHYEGGEEDGR